MSIVISDLCKSYGLQKAIDNVSFRVADNEITGFLGPNGAGKSTTMKIITGYIQADAGQVKVNDIDVSGNPLGVKKKIGYLPEHNPLYPEMYIAEYLEFVAGIYKLRNNKSQRLKEVIELTGLTDERRKKIGQLSKGYRQRVGLAAALIHDPEVIILDEPTSGLDPNQIIEIREVIRRLGKNKTVLFSSHILQEVESICDRVVIINKGKIVADDTLPNLQAAKDYNQIIILELAAPHDVEDLEKIEGVLKIDQSSPTSFRLQTNDAEKVKKNLFSFSLNNHINIVSIQSEQTSLENIFRNLTGNIQNN